MQTLAAIPREALINNLVRKYMVILDIKKPPTIEIKNRIAPGWLGRCHSNGLIELLSSILADLTTLERVVAHEMIHWRNFSVAGKQDDDPKGHGTSFEEGAAIVNAKMGKDFVTKFSDQSYVQSKNMQHYYLVVWPRKTGGYGWVWSAGMSDKGKAMVSAIDTSVAGEGQPSGLTKVFKTTEDRWLQGRKLTSPGKTSLAGWSYSIAFPGTDDEKSLGEIYNETNLPVGTFKVKIK
jgi:hypothetical protein